MDSGVSPNTVTAEKSDAQVAAPAETSSLQQPQKQDFTSKVKDANSPSAIRELLEEAKRTGLRAPKPGEESPKAEGNQAADIPPDLKAAEEAEKLASEQAQESQPEEAPTSEETQPATDEDGDAETDAETDDGEVTPIKSKKLHLRIPDGDEVGRLALAYMKRNRDLTMEDALSRARTKLGIKPQQEQTQQTQPQEPESKLPKTLEDVETAIKNLRAERKKANTDLRFEDAADLSDQLEDMIQHRFSLERQAERQQAEQVRSYEQKFRGSEAKAIELYDFANKPDSPAGKRMIEIDEMMKDNGDPTYDDPNKPLIIAQMVAREMSIAPRKKGTPAGPVKTATQTAPAPQQPKKGLVPSGASRTTPTAVNQKPAIIAAAEQAKSIKDIRDIRKALGLSY